MTLVTANRIKEKLELTCAAVKGPSIKRRKGSPPLYQVKMTIVEPTKLTVSTIQTFVIPDSLKIWLRSLKGQDNV